MTDERPSDLSELEAKISKARATVRDATFAAREETRLTELETARAKMLDAARRKRIAELTARCPDLPDLWTWNEDGEAVDMDGDYAVYSDHEDVIFDDDGDSACRPIEVVRAVLARHDADTE